MTSTVAPSPAGLHGRLLTVAGSLLLVAAALSVATSPLETLSLLTIVLVGVFLLSRPHWAVLLVWVLLFVRIVPYRVGPLNTAEALGMTLVIPLALQILRERWVWTLQVPHVRLLLAIGGMLLAATAWSRLMHTPPPIDTLVKSWEHLFAYFRFLLLLICFISFIKTPRHLRYAVGVMLGLILAAVADAWGVFGEAPGERRAAATTFGGFSGNENRLAFLCVWGTSLVWFLRFKGPAGWWRPLTMVPLVVLPVTTIMTGSRSGLLQLVLLGILTLLEQRQWSVAQRVRGLAVIAALAVVVVVAAPEDMVERATHLDAGGPTTIDRIHAIRAGFQMVVEYPLFGVGPGNFNWRNEQLTGSTMSPHNAYVAALAAGGPLLLALYLALFFRVYQTLRAVERYGAGEFLWLATALRVNVITLLLFSAFATVWHAEPVWLLIGLTIILARVSPVRASDVAGRPVPAALARRPEAW